MYLQQTKLSGAAALFILESLTWYRNAVFGDVVTIPIIAVGGWEAVQLLVEIPNRKRPQTDRCTQSKTVDQVARFEIPQSSVLLRGEHALVLLSLNMYTDQNRLLTSWHCLPAMSPT